jgi:electron transfer flavoprotein beta subunit
MKILVCISVVPDTTSKITIDQSSSLINYDGLTFIVGPYDDYALSRALEIKEINQAEVVVLHVGNAESEPLIRKCLALGADRAIRINADSVDSNQIANEITDYVKENAFDLILMGKESIDYNSALVHSLVANQLGFHHFSPVMKLDVLGEDRIEILVETDEGKANVKCQLPVVLGCQEPIAEWKIPSMRGIMLARTKTIQVVELKSSALIQIKQCSVKENNRQQIMISADNAESLIDILKSESLI